MMYLHFLLLIDLFGNMAKYAPPPLRLDLKCHSEKCPLFEEKKDN